MKDAPAPGKELDLTLLVIPNDFGVLPVPTLTLGRRRKETSKGHKKEENDGGGLEEKFVMLSDAQVANHCLGQFVTCSGSL